MEIGYGISYFVLAVFAGWKSRDEKNWGVFVGSILVAAIGSAYTGMYYGL